MKLNTVPPESGKVWGRLGISTFMRQPLALSGLFFLSMAIARVLALIPYIGDAMVLLVSPLLSLGLMVASQQASEGRFPMPTVLFEGFRAGAQKLRAFLILGAIYAGAVLLIFAVVGWIDGGELARAQQALGPVNELMKQSPEAQQAAVPALWSFLMRQLSYLLLLTLMYIPVSLAFWHAPALVYWHGVPAIKSLFFSIVACTRNVKAMAVFALYWVVVGFSVTLPLVLLASALGGLDLAAVLIVPVTLVLTAMYFTSLYFSYRDSFAEINPESVQPFEPQELP